MTDLRFRLSDSTTLPGVASTDDEHAAAIFGCSFEAWYPALAPLGCTPRSRVIPLSPEQRKDMYRACCSCRNKEDPAPALKSPSLVDVVAKVQEAIMEFEGAAFVKLSTRSPKDAALQRPEYKIILKHLLSKGDGSDNSDTIAVVTATRLAMKITNAEQAMQLLVNSERVYGDLMRALDHPKLVSQFSIIVREWVPMMPHQEFRAFISGSNVTAISQYCYYQYWPDVAKNKAVIGRRICEFLQGTIIPAVKSLTNFVVDLQVLNDRVRVIELNPFGPDTSGCLFNWSDRTDNSILHNGPFEIRVVDKILPDVRQCLSWNQWTLVKECKPPVKKLSWPLIIFLVFCLLLPLSAAILLYKSWH
ncbi:cell division cycle protein 123-like [Pelomyxa schiedti]|nr:cell division cycle protein 123-like [Pelomyxa schiedti]